MIKYCEDCKLEQLNEIWRRYDFIVNTSQELMALVTTGYRYEAVNDAYCWARNLPREKIIGNTVRDLWGDDIFSKIIKAPLDRCFVGEIVNYQAWFVLGVFGLRCMDVTYYPYKDAQQQVTHVVVVSRDITEREQALQELRQYADQLQFMVDARTKEIEQKRQVAEGLRYILAIINSSRSLNEILEYIASEAERLLGAEAFALFGAGTDIIGCFSAERHAKAARELRIHFAHRLSLLLSSELDYYQSIVQKVLSERKPFVLCLSTYPNAPTTEQWQTVKSIDNYQTLLFVPLMTGSEAYAGLLFCYKLPRQLTDEEVHLAMTLGDHVALAIENAHLQRRAKEAAIWEERERLGRDLHDSVTQSVYSLTLYAEAIQRLLATREIPKLQEHIAQLDEIARQALKEMRLLLYEMRPTALEHEGLAGAIKKRLDAVERRAGVSAELYVKEPLILPAFVEEGLYRIIQESLNNSLKHSECTAVSVSIEVNSSQVRLEVKDNGNGFDLNTSVESGGMGLMNIRERTHQLGGDLSIESSSTVGTSILITVPFALS